MANDTNNYEASGRLTKDFTFRMVTSKKTGEQTPLATSSLAVNRNDGKTCFWDIAVWGFRAEHLASAKGAEIFRQGAKVLVRGYIELDEWTTDDDQKRTKHKLVVREIAADSSCMVPRRSETMSAEEAAVAFANKGAQRSEIPGPTLQAVPEPTPETEEVPETEMAEEPI